jgi:hypothetical protein
MNLLIPLAVVAGLFVMSQSNNSSKSTSKKDDKDQILIPGVIVKPSKQGTLDLGKIKCKINQYYDEEMKTCVEFWNDAVHEGVKQELLKEAVKFYNKPDLGNAYIPNLCEDQFIPDPEGISGTWIQNPNQLAIIKTVINRLWPMISMNALPPKKSDPEWLHTLWNNVIETYSEVICMNG